MALADRPIFAYACTLGLTLALVSPTLRKAPRDSFPLSTFSMFAELHEQATVTVNHAVSLDAEGRDTPIGPRLLGTDEVLQARATVTRAIRKGPAAATELCKTLAQRVASATEHATARTVELRTTRLDAVRWFTADEGSRPAPLGVKVHATCPVRAAGSGR